MKTSIRNGRLIDPASNLDDQQDLFIADGKVVALGKAPDGFQAELDIDAGDHIVCPGLIDLCARLREPGQEHKGTIASETAAAVSGGVTGICFAPDTSPVLDSPPVAELIHQRANSVNLARVLPLGAMTVGLAGKILTDMGALQEIGCIGVSNANQDMENADVLRRTLEYASGCDLTVHLFCEDPSLKNNGVVHEGPLSTRLGLPAIPAAAETVSVSRALLLAEQTGARIHLSRITSARSVALIAEARRQGLAISADVGIAHLQLNDTAIDEFNSLCHLDPPLRSESDRESLLEGLRNGTIDAICSDHSPHDKDAKAAPFSLTEPGASTIEHLLGLVMRLVKENHLDLSQGIAAITQRPSEIARQDLGRLEVGQPADVCIFSMDSPVIIDNKTMISAGKNTPFHGWELPARVSHTLVNGRVVYTAA